MTLYVVNTLQMVREIMKQKHLETLWFCAFRYCLGRSSYLVSDFEAAFLENFEETPEKTKRLILRELRYEFEREEVCASHNMSKLGQHCNRAYWQNVLFKLREWGQSCQ